MSTVLTKENELSKAMYNPLEKATKKSDLKKTIASHPVSESEKRDPHLISLQLDRFENRLIKKRKFKER